MFVELPEAGTDVAQGTAFGVVESVKAASDVYAPVSGTIAEVNAALSDEPELINADPYGRGWLIKIKVSDTAPLDAQMDADAYLAYNENR